MVPDLGLSYTMNQFSIQSIVRYDAIIDGSAFT